MDIPHNVPVRNARDRVIDLLQIGDAYPLTDLNVVADQLKVSFGGAAKIPIEDAQAGVLYQLCDPKGKPLGDAFKAEGENALLKLETPSVQEDVTYRVMVTKKLTRADLPAQAAPRFLDERAPVKVGLDTRLVIEILDAPLLDAALASPQPSDARIVPYGRSVDVRVNKSQEGVKYSLMLDAADVVPEIAAMGDLGDIVLRTPPMTEDTVIQVRASKKFLQSENRADESSPLDAKLYLKVMANPAAAVSAELAIVDYNQDAAIKVAGAQQSAKYRLYARILPDADFVHGATRERNLVTIAVPNRPDAPAQVRAPAPAELWRTPEGYAPLGEAAAPAGGGVTLAAKARTEDSIFIVQALKDHRVDAAKPDSRIITSAVPLSQAAVVLVRPDPARALALRVPVSGPLTGRSMQVSGGQPGVFYFFTPSSGAEFRSPAYFHKRDQQDAPQNKGIGQLAIEVDLAIAADPAAGPAANPAMAEPRLPLLDIVPFPAGASLSSRAMKAQTLVETKMAQAALVAALPPVRADPQIVDYGASARIVIPASNPADVYQVTLNGAPVKGALAGNGSELAVPTDALTADATFELVATRPADKGMKVERVAQLPVLVRPDAGLPVSARVETVAAGTQTDILVQRTQRGVNYQLMAGQTAIGAAVAGTGADIALPSGPIAVDTTFTVAAARAGNPQVATVLKAQASVKVLIAPIPPAPPAPPIT